MNFWVIVGIILVLVCICTAISSSEESSAKAEKAAKEALEHSKQSAARETARLAHEKEERLLAKRPEAMMVMLREEFPQFSADFTYARSKAILDWYQTRGIEARDAAMRKAPGDAPALLGMLFSRECAPIVSDSFAAYATENPATAWNRMVMCADGSAIRAQGM